MEITFYIGIEGYFRSHPLPEERISQIQRMTASEGWPARSERDLAVAFLFWTARAQESLNQHKYQQAEQLAQRSLKVRREQPEAWDLLARAQFSQANFSEAANSYRKLLESDPKKPGDLESFAMALVAANRRGAAGEFKNWLESLRGEIPRNAGVEQAGLSLVAGDTSPAHRLEMELEQSSDSWGPEYLGELGWWHYVAGNYEHAVELLGQVVQQRPGDTRMWLRRAWAEIEVRRYSDAIQTVNNGAWENGSANEERPHGERAMAQAVAFWLAREPDEALRDYDRAMAGQPEWGNPNWVKALYSPLVAQGVEEMRAERERQRKARLAEKH